MLQRVGGVKHTVRDNSLKNNAAIAGAMQPL